MEPWVKPATLASSNEGSDFYILFVPIGVHIDFNSFKNVGSKAYYQSGLTLGSYNNQWEFVPLWDKDQPEISSLPRGYNMYTTDSTTIYLQPTRESGFIIHTTDKGQSWTKKTRGPAGAMHKGVLPGSSWIRQTQTCLLYTSDAADE